MLPVGIAYWPIERSRWLVAAAENELESTDEKEGSRRRAEAFLNRAKLHYAAIEHTLDFARVSFRLHPEETERAIKLVQSLEPSRQAHAANVLSELRLESEDFDAAYEILKACYPRSENRKAEQRNQLAYYAALADRDLDLALAEIEKALSGEKNASFLDTKAWVLFRLKRYDEALMVIDQALAELEIELKNASNLAPVQDKIQDLLDGKKPFVKRPLEDKSDPLAYFNKSFAQAIKSIVVIHYHRGEILEGAGKTEEADHEYSWVQDRGFNDFERLY